MLYMFFWVSPDVRLWFADVSEPSVSSIFKGFEDGTDRGFRNVFKPQSDAGEIPKRTYTTDYLLEYGFYLINWTRADCALCTLHFAPQIQINK